MKLKLFTFLMAIVGTSPLMAQPAVIVIPAADLAAPEQMAATPTPGKWWLNRNAKGWGAPKDTILMTGQPSTEIPPGGLWEVLPMFRFVPDRVPELIVDPKVSGWYRIYVGLYRDDIDFWSPPMLQGKLTGEKFPEFLQAPRDVTTRTAEVYWKAADLTGKKIHLQQPPGPMTRPGSGWMGGVTHLRLVPLTTEDRPGLVPASEREIAMAKREDELPPINQRLFAMLDTTDAIFWNGTVEKEEDIHQMIWQHHQAGFGRIYWRTYGTCLDNSLAVPAAAPRWSDQDELKFKEKNKSKGGWMDYIGLARRFDPLKVAVEYGREIGNDVHAMVRFNNYNRPPFANFYHEHPEFRVQMLNSVVNPATGERVITKPYKRHPYAGRLSFAHPEVRTYYVSFFKQIASTGTKGIMIDLLRHPILVGFEPISSEAFKQKYGEDMEPLNIYKDPKIQDHMADYMRLFLVELRQAIGYDIEISVRCTGPNRFGLKGKEFIQAGLVNTIIDGHWYSNNGPRSTIDETVEAVGTRGKAMAGTEMYDVDPWNNWSLRKDKMLSAAAIEGLAKAYSGRGVAALGLYESNVHVWSPDVRRAIRAAGWSYEPRKTKTADAPLKTP